MSGEQLERSILERKEREELKAIATAMSLEPVARTKKADLVDQILRAAGVEISEGGNAGTANGAVPGASGPPRSATEAAGDGIAATAVLTAAGTDDSLTPVGTAGEIPNGKAPRPRVARTRTAKPKADPVAATGSVLGDAGSASAETEEGSAPAGAATGSGHGEGDAVVLPPESGSGNGGDGPGEDAPAGEGTTDRPSPRRSAAASRRGASSNGAGSLTQAAGADTPSDATPAAGTSPAAETSAAAGGGHRADLR